MQSEKCKMRKRGTTTGVSCFCILHFAFCLPSLAGSITATFSPDAKIADVAAVQRRFTNIGVYEQTFTGRVEGDRIRIDDLPDGLYDLRLTLEDGTIVHGWDATVPPSDYVEEQPLSLESKRTILEKLATHHGKQFFDEVLVLDIVGNVQHAAVLVTQVRRRPFVGGGYREGEWVWRVDRWAYEFPDEDTWVPVQERPFYALFRERLDAKSYAAKRIVFARHLGGITIREKVRDVDLGIIAILKAATGVSAINPDGSATRAISIKPDRIAEHLAAEGVGP